MQHERVPSRSRAAPVSPPCHAARASRRRSCRIPCQRGVQCYQSQVLPAHRAPAGRECGRNRSGPGGGSASTDAVPIGGDFGHRGFPLIEWKSGESASGGADAGNAFSGRRCGRAAQALRTDETMRRLPFGQSAMAPSRREHGGPNGKPPRSSVHHRFMALPTSSPIGSNRDRRAVSKPRYAY